MQIPPAQLVLIPRREQRLVAFELVDLGAEHREVVLELGAPRAEQRVRGEA